MDDGKPSIRKVLTAAGMTEMPWLPLRFGAAASVAATPCQPAVLNVTVKVCTPASAVVNW